MGRIKECLVDGFCDNGRFELLILGLSFFVVAYHSLQYTWLSAWLLPLCFALLLAKPDIIKCAWLWGLLSVILVASNVLNWSMADNHAWLFALWALTICVVYARVSPSQRVVILQQNAMWMIVCVMLLAVVQKALVSEYVDGSFFTFTLLTDSRFLFLSHYVADISFSSLINNAILVQELLAHPSATTAQLHTNEHIAQLGIFMTWWVFIIELLIALCFLVRSSVLAQKIGHILNLVFICVVYTLAPVYGFGALLSILGLQMSRGVSRSIYGAYMVAFVYMLLLDVSWTTFLISWFDPFLATF